MGLDRVGYTLIVGTYDLEVHSSETALAKYG